MGIDDIVRGATKIGDARQTQRFAEQISRRSFDEPTIATEVSDPTVGDDVVVIDAKTAPGTDFGSSFITAPENRGVVDRAVLRLGEAEGPRSIDEDVIQGQDNFLDREVARITNQLGITQPEQTRIRRDFPGPTAPASEPATLVPHAVFRDIPEDDLLRFLDRGQDTIVSNFSDFLDDLL